MPEIKDQDMIQDSLGKNPFPAWLWFTLIIVLFALLWGGGSWLITKKQEILSDSPFLQVTNREFSLFLWQNPEYMRANVSSKTAYLPGFQYEDKISIQPGQAEKYVSAPPEVIFLYHVWSRLISKEFAERKVPVNEFKDFLSYSPEWLPENWPKAPENYKEILKNLPKNSTQLVNGLPWEVERAFIGWKNYFMEGAEINLIQPTYAEMQEFISTYPNYARNFWRNIVQKGRPQYLKTLTIGKFEPEEKIPNEEITGFLKVAFFNYKKAKSNS